MKMVWAGHEYGHGLLERVRERMGGPPKPLPDECSRPDPRTGVIRGPALASGRPEAAAGPLPARSRCRAALFYPAAS